MFILRESDSISKSNNWNLNKDITVNFIFGSFLKIYFLKKWINVLF